MVPKCAHHMASGTLIIGSTTENFTEQEFNSSQVHLLLLFFKKPSLNPSTMQLHTRVSREEIKALGGSGEDTQVQVTSSQA